MNDWLYDIITDKDMHARYDMQIGGFQSIVNIHTVYSKQISES